MKKLLSALALAIVAGAMSAAVAVAAAPDGLGPWADTVVDSNQGLTKGGGAVPVERSDPTAALGVAEDDTDPTHFFSLGFGGDLTVGFDNGISSGVFVVEATNEGYPVETAAVEVSEDGVAWYAAGEVSQDGTVSLPDEVTCGKYVRITDTSNPDDFPEDEADAYDVDGVRAEGDRCTTDGKMTGGGSVFMEDGTRVTHGFQLACSTSDTSNNLQINWGKGNKFHLKSLDSVLCSYDPAITPDPPVAGFNTYHGTGSGRVNGVDGYTAEWLFTDAGEPGKEDVARIVVRDPASVVVFTASGLIDRGNHQAH